MEDICAICGIEDVSDLGTLVCYKCSKTINNLGDCKSTAKTEGQKQSAEKKG